ncbi:hypothetical protein [Salipiger sp.]|uniref:hypothetical protein n=1 Tax=Salipiger sp. TaxID=2078585 RepID=UPI003A96E624
MDALFARARVAPDPTPDTPLSGLESLLAGWPWPVTPQGLTLAALLAAGPCAAIRRRP